MTTRYRCLFCGTAFSAVGAARVHMFKRHRKGLIDGLGLIETYGTPEEEIAP